MRGGGRFDTQPYTSIPSEMQGESTKCPIPSEISNTYLLFKKGKKEHSWTQNVCLLLVLCTDHKRWHWPFNFLRLALLMHPNIKAKRAQNANMTVKTLNLNILFYSFARIYNFEISWIQVKWDTWAWSSMSSCVNTTKLMTEFRVHLWRVKG